MGKVDKLVIVSEYFSDNYPKFTKFSRFIQKALWYIGIAVYNPITGEDTPDFNNAIKTKNTRFAFIRYSKKVINNNFYWLETDIAPRITHKQISEFASSYSHDVWKYLMKKHKSSSELGFNDVSDLIMNAILDSEYLKPFERKINNKVNNNDDNNNNPL